MAANVAKYTAAEAKACHIAILEQIVRLRTERLGDQAGQQVVRFGRYLDTKTNWLTAPASTKYHLCVDAGLLIHSVTVAERAFEIAALLCPELPIDSVLFCGLFHDVGKVWSYTRADGGCSPRYEDNILKSGQRSEAEPYRYSKGGHEIALTIRDLILPLKFVDLSDAEMQALMYADGPFVNINDSLRHNEHPLSLVIHISDYWQSHVIEGGIQASWLSGVLRP
jgi:hypothetical protein